LVAFGRQHKERLLGQIAGIGLSSRQAERESVKRLVMLGYDFSKAVQIRSTLRSEIGLKLHSFPSAIKTAHPQWD